MEVLEMTAKVLATEGITVEKRQVKTAYFNLATRVLTLPMWENLEPHVEDMLMCHEVSHALFTPIDYSESLKAEPHLSSILNVVEDPRVERLFKERYPGSRRVFAAAYKTLREIDFFELGSKSVAELNFVDRLNVYFKLGPLSGVVFSRAEAPFVGLAQNAVTFEDALDAAKKIYAFIKDRAENQTSALQAMLDQLQDSAGVGDDDFDGDEGFGDFDEDEGEGFGEEFDDGFGDEEGDRDDTKGEGSTESKGETDDGDDTNDGNGRESDNKNAKNKRLSDELKSVTDEAFSRKLSEMTTDGPAPVYVEFSEDYENYPNLVVSYKKVIEKVQSYFATAHEDDYHYRELKQRTFAQVNHLVQLFDLKKAADIYARRRITKTGNIDAAKIAAYKFKDDIFRKSIRIPEGKNHGMVLLLDWSSSMNQNGVINNSMEQIQQLVQFCRRTAIPFKVLAFTDMIGENTIDPRSMAPDTNYAQHLSLLELFDNKMSLADYNRMMQYCSSMLVRRVYGGGYTPLAPALLAMRKVLPEFIRENQVQKLTFMVFSDGANTVAVQARGDNGNFVWGHRGSVIFRDTVLHKTYQVCAAGEYRTQKYHVNTINTMFRMIKDRFDTTNISFFITASGTGNKLNACVWSGMSDDAERFINNPDNDAKFRKEGFMEYTGYGRDKVFLVNQKILYTGYMKSSDPIDGNMTANAIARNLTKGSKRSLKGKVLLEKFVDTIA